VGHGQELAGPAQAAMDKGDDDEQDTLLRKALTDLSPDERAVLIRKKAGFSIDEISDYYRKSAEAVEAQIERVRQVLRRLIRDRH
jgi:DNA-directed RNA polymerase specialized sigma24 family protein